MAKEATAPLRVAVSRLLHNYLGLLKRNTVLGASENDVATYLLTQQLERMMIEGYLEKNLESV
jgi:hypothetical protein